MIPSDGRHLDDEQAERYSLGQASEAESAEWEEHLLVCDECRSRVAENDRFTSAMHDAAAELRAGNTVRARRRATFRLLPAFAGVALAALLLLAWLGTRSSNSAPPLAVTLTAPRGPEIGAKAPSRVPLALRPDLTGLPEWPSCGLEVVDRLGNRVWRGRYPGPPAPPLSEGAYFVRLYAPSGELVREYGLAVEDRR